MRGFYLSMHRTELKLAFYMFAFLLTIGTDLALAQSATKPIWDVKNPFERKAFIENVGQFDSEVSKKIKVKCAAHVTGVNYYFTNQGVVLQHDHITSRLRKSKENDERNEDEAKESRERIVSKVTKQNYSVEWLGINEQVEMILKNKKNEYFTYGTTKGSEPITALGYEELIYKNIYEGIDLVYTFPKDSAGIRYHFVVHPNADASQIKWEYSKQAALAFDAGKNLLVQSDFGTVTEHKPYSFIQGDFSTEIESFFSVSGNIAHFKIGNYDKQQTLIIDPWVVNPNFSSVNKVYDIERDGFGNLYVFGGQNPYLLRKYSSGGVPIWTHTTTFTGWYGDLALEPNGIAYISEGYSANNSYPSFAKVNAAGVQQFNVQGPAGQLEYWCLNFNCDFTQLTVSGGVSAGNISFLNTATGAQNTTTNVSNNEPRGMSKAPNGNYYCLTHSGSEVIALNPAFGNIFTVPSGYSFSYSIPAYNTSYTSPDAGYNCIYANNSVVYITNGITVDKRNAVTGASMASAPIPGGTITASGGVQVDNCGNVYIGGNTAVYKYDSNLNLLSNYPTSGTVHGICLSASTGELIAAGNGFLASLDTLNPCISANLGNLQLIATTYCPDSAKVSVVNASANGAYTFIWKDTLANTVVANNTMPAGISSNTVTGLSQGVVYQVTVIEVSTCQTQISSIFLEIACGIPLNIVLCPGDTYTLSNGTVISTPGVYNDTLTNSQGLDSILVITLSNYVVSNVTVNASICQGQTYTLPNGSTANTTGLYTHTFTDIHGCDSIINTNLVVHPNTSSLINLNICSGQAVTLPNGTVVTAAGLYTVTYNTSLGCDSLINYIVGVGNSTSSLINASICANQNYTLPNGTIVTQGGIYTSTIPNSQGCDSVITVNLLVKPITNVTVNASICQGGAYTLPNGNIVTTQGSYPVSFLGSNGCDSIVTTNLSVNPTTINNVSATICINDTYTFVDGTTSNISGTYSHILVGANSKGCDSLIVTQLSAVPLPVALLDDYVLCAGQNDSVTLSVDDNIAFSYLWSNGSTNSFIKVFQTDTFSVVVSAPPCPSFTDSSIVEVLDCTCKVFIPSAFSPNDDGKNDGFKPTIKCLSAVLNYKFIIFNRWGQRIFDTYNISTFWDGKYQGVTQDIGTYYYQIQFSHPDVGNKLYKGDINLIR